MNRFFLKTFVFLLIIIGFSISPLLPQRAKAQVSDAVCSINVSVSGRTVTVTASVTESKPGLDPSDVSVSISDDAPGGINKSASLHDDSITIIQTVNNFPIGNWTAVVEGDSQSNPGGGSSTCEDDGFFTVVDPEVEYELNVSKSGSGSGTVSGPGISCGSGSGCDEDYESGTLVTLTANPSSGSTFAGWSGACSGTGSCVVNMSTNRNVTATFNTSAQPPGDFSTTGSGCFAWPNPEIEVNFNPSSGATSYTLERRLNGSGGYSAIFSGSYSALDAYGDANISAGNEYEYRIRAVNSVGTKLSSNTRSEFVSQDNCGGGTITLSVDIGSGSGTIAGTGISCPSDCTNTYSHGNWATITASASTGYAFSSWSGACAGQGSSCSLYMDGNKFTSANFIINNYTLTVTKSGPGTVSGTGISCGSDCTETYAYNTSVTLTAAADPGATFSGWSGACSGTGSCAVTMSTARNVTATFTTNSYALSVSKSGTGSGTVNGTGISCGSDCSESYAYNTSVTLTNSPTAGSAFAGWSGACTGTGPCVVSMTVARSVTATFNTVPFNYSLSNSGTSSVTKGSGNVFTQNTITKNLIEGTTQSVSLVPSGVPSGVSYSISSSTCSPTCSSTITFTVSPSATVGTHNITVTGSPLSKITNFNLVIAGNPFTVSCSATPASPTKAILGETVTFSATVSGGVAPLTYTWSGTNVPTSPAPSTNPYSRSYSTIGVKSAEVTVRDADGVQSTCPPAMVEVTFDPDFEEF